MPASKYPVAEFYQLPVGVSANFVFSCDLSYRDSSGSSRGISSIEDRTHLIALRRQADAVVTGGETARQEDYSPRSGFDTYIFSKKAAGKNILSFASKHELLGLFEMLESKHEHVLLETGPSLLKVFFESKLVDSLFLSFVHAPNCGHGDLDDVLDLLVLGAKEKLSYADPVEVKHSIIGRTQLVRLDFGVPKA